MYGPCLCFVKFVSGGCSRLLLLVSYLWISLLLLNKCLLLRFYLQCGDVGKKSTSYTVVQLQTTGYL
jgi:hypothetical protein